MFKQEIVGTEVDSRFQREKKRPDEIQSGSRKKISSCFKSSTNSAPNGAIYQHLYHRSTKFSMKTRQWAEK